MTKGAETAIAERWIDSTLKNNVALAAIVGARIWADYSPLNPTMPFVIYNMQTTEDMMGVGTARIWTDSLYIVKAISQGTFSDLAATAEAIDAALTTPIGGAVTGGQVITCIRQRPFRLVEVDGGTTFRHLGGQYQILAQGS